MKYVQFFLLLFSVLVNAQDSTTVKVETPKIVAKLHHGATYIYKDVSISFLKVISDSRCPKNSKCIRAGNVKVLVAVFNKGKKVEERVITLASRVALKNKLNLIFNSDTFSISGFDLMPYPVSGKKINSEDYVLQLQLNN